MRKGRTVIGQDVYGLAEGVRLHSVKDIVISEDNRSILALLIDEGGLMATSKIVPIESVARFGPAAVMVEDGSVVREADDDARVAEILQREGTLLGSAVLTSDGDDLGKISDIYFDERTGGIYGFEVSGGRIGDLMHGTSFLSLDEVRVVGPDAVIANVEAKDHLAEQRGGLEAAADSMQEALGSMQEQAGSALEDMQHRAGDALEGASATVEQVGDPDAKLVGRRARADVADRSGSIIVANGQRVDLEQVHRAREEGVIEELYGATGVERARPVGEQADELAQRAGETASDLWDRFTRTLSDMTDTAGRRLDQEQVKRRLGSIHDAIGRPVTKVFLDRNDDVILDLGDIVTHQAVQRVHEVGQLDQLLDSVYRAEVTFERDELRAGVKGDSTVESASGGARLIEELEAAEADLSGDTGSGREGGFEEASRPGAGATNVHAPQTSSSEASSWEGASRA